MSLIAGIAAESGTRPSEIMEWTGDELALVAGFRVFQHKAIEKARNG